MMTISRIALAVSLVLGLATQASAAERWYLADSSKRSCGPARDNEMPGFGSPLELEKQLRSMDAYSRTDIKRDNSGNIVAVAVYANKKIDGMAMLYFHDLDLCNAMIKESFGSSAELR